MSRTLGELPYWDDRDKDYLDKLLRKLLAFSGLELVSFCIMGNHFHLLLGVPSQRKSLESMTDAQFLKRLEILYSESVVQLVAMRLDLAHRSGAEDAVRKVREPYLQRMHNLSAFMQELKQRFSTYYNKRHQRQGPLWRDRFKSVMVEGSADALRTMAAYIDLNPVRAKLVKDPKDYRWSGYAKAVVGDESARKGLAWLVRSEVGEDASTRRWSQVQAIYRCWLYEAGEEQRNETGHVVKRGFKADEVEAVQEAAGRLAYPVLAKLRIRHFSQGVAIGSRAFVEDAFQRHRGLFGEKRVDGARSISGVQWAGLVNLRELRSA